MAIFQFNDAPKGMARQDMKDKDRVYPGDGILPLPQILRDLKNTGFNRCISVELYNPEYYKNDLLEVAKTGLDKTLKVIERSEESRVGKECRSRAGRTCWRRDET